METEKSPKAADSPLLPSALSLTNRCLHNLGRDRLPVSNAFAERPSRGQMAKPIDPSGMQRITTDAYKVTIKDFLHIKIVS